MMHRLIVCVVVLGAAALLSGCQGLSEALPGILDGQRELNTETITAGVKEALRVGAERAATTASRDGAYGPNSPIRIPMPDQLNRMASALRTIGLGSEVDRFEAAMNNAAEAAAAQAAPVFADAVRQMTFADVREIWQGGDTAATDYFRGKTSARLAELYHPIVEAKLQEVGAVRVYDDLLQRYQKIPLAPQPQFTLPAYATQGALDGLFTLLADEEAKIRHDPVARTTSLLRRVFGAQ